MSGPKTSKYSLTPEQRRILEEQRKLERRKAVASEKIRQSRKRLLQIGGMFDGQRQIAKELSAANTGDNGMSSLLEELDSLITPTTQPVVGAGSGDVNALEQAADTIGATLKKAEKLVSGIQALSAENEAKLKSELRAAIEKGFETSFADIQEIKSSSTQSLRSEAAQRLISMQSIDFLPQDCKSEIKKALEKIEQITDDSFLKNFIAVSINPLIKQANRFISEYNECREEFNRLYAEYVALCELYYYTAQEYVCSQSSVQALEAEIERIKKAVAEDDEQAYISDCLDEVMAEMGYTVLGSREVTKRNGKRFRNELYSYGEGTAVNVTYSSDGKIAMELGGIDKSDRPPTPQETDKLCDSMEQFCDDFKEIERKLLSKGVVLADRVSLLPPEPDYAQIINTSDYSMETEADSINVKKRQSSGSKRKALRKE